MAWTRSEACGLRNEVASLSNQWSSAVAPSTTRFPQRWFTFRILFCYTPKQKKTTSEGRFFLTLFGTVLKRVKFTKNYNNSIDIHTKRCHNLTYNKELVKEVFVIYAKKAKS